MKTYKPALYYLLILAAFASCQNNGKKEPVINNKEISNDVDNGAASAGIPEKYRGVFSKEVETEATTTGMAGITYTFSVSDSTVTLDEITYHEPTSCSGSYRAVEKDGILELYYDGDEEHCEAEGPNFQLKKEGTKFFMKGLGGEGSYHTWIEVKKE